MKQSLATAYNMKRRSRKMADGGQVSEPSPKQTLGSAIGFPGSPKPKNMAKGGMVEGMSDSEYGAGQPGMSTPTPGEDSDTMRDSEMGRGMPSPSIKISIKNSESEDWGLSDSEMGHFAEGGQVGEGLPGKSIDMPDENDLMNHEDESSEMGRGMPKSASESVMSKHKSRMMADGGQVDIEMNAQEEDMTAADSKNQQAALKENYDEGMHSVADRVRRKKMSFSR